MSKGIGSDESGFCNLGHWEEVAAIGRNKKEG